MRQLVSPNGGLWVKLTSRGLVVVFCSKFGEILLILHILRGLLVLGEVCVILLLQGLSLLFAWFLLSRGKFLPAFADNLRYLGEGQFTTSQLLACF